MKRKTTICFILLLLSFAALPVGAQEQAAFVIPPQFEMAGPFCEGLACITVNGRDGFLNESGQITIPIQYDLASDFQNGRAVVQKDGKYGMVDRDGNACVPIQYTQMDVEFEPGTPIYAEYNGKFGFIDETGKTVIPFIYSNVNMIGFNEGLCGVQADGPYGFINEKGETVIPFDIRFAGHFKEKVAQVHNGDKWGLMTRDGTVPLGYIFDEIGWSMNESVIAVCKDGKWALSNGNEMLTEFKYDGFDMYMAEGLISALKEDKWGYLDNQGKEAIPCRYESASRFSEGLAAVSQNGKYGFIDRGGKLVLPFTYDGADSFWKGICAVNQNGKWGLIDRDGEVIVPFRYDAISNTGGTLLAAAYNNAWGYIYNPTSKEPSPKPVPENPQIEAMLPSKWARSEVAEAFANNLADQTMRGEYDKDVTRAEFCKLTIRLIEQHNQMHIFDILEERGLRIETGGFWDTIDETVLAARALGIVSGEGNGRFRPDDAVTREEAAVMLARSLQVLRIPVPPMDSVTFIDESDCSAWAAESIRQVSGRLKTGLYGEDENRFYPKGHYTREQALVVMVRLFKTISGT